MGQPRPFWSLINLVGSGELVNLFDPLSAIEPFITVLTNLATRIHLASLCWSKMAKIPSLALIDV